MSLNESDLESAALEWFEMLPSRLAGGGRQDSASAGGTPVRRLGDCGELTCHGVVKGRNRSGREKELDSAIAQLSAMLSEKLATKFAIGEVSSGPESSLAVSPATGADTKKAQEIPGFVALCHLLSSCGFSLRVGEEGLE